MAEFLSHPVQEGPEDFSGGSIRYDPGAFSTAQSKLNAVIDELTAIAERFSASADALIGSIEGPVSAFEGCTDSLKTSLFLEIFELSGMVSSLGNSLNQMIATDRKRATELQNIINP